MSIDGPDETAIEASPGRSDGGSLGLLRAVSLAAVVVGAMGSVGLMLRAGQRTPRLLLVLFTIWVISPFVALLWANIVSKCWSAVTRTALYCVTLVVTLGSLATYGELVVIRPPGSANAFLFVAVPPASWVFMTIVVPRGLRRPSRRGTGAWDRVANCSESMAFARCRSCIQFAVLSHSHVQRIAEVCRLTSGSTCRQPR